MNELFEQLIELERKADDDAPKPRRAIVAEDAAGAGQMIFVTVPDFDEFSHWGPCTWRERVEVGDDGAVNVVYPSKGDDCLIVEDGDGQVWILDWWPYGGIE